MSERWPLQKEEIRITPIGWDKELNTLEKSLQDKIPNDKEKYNKFLDIFSSIKEKEIFTEENIVAYIEETNINHLNRRISTAWEDTNKIVIESIDMFLGTTIKTQETREEKKEIYNEVVNNNNEVVNTSNEVINTSNEIVKENIDKEQRIKSRKATQKSYDNLNKKDQITDEQLQEQKATIPQIVIDAVNKKTQGTELKSDDFLKFYLLGENKANKDKPELQDFMKNYIELKKDLEIPETISFSTASTPEHTDRIIQENKHLYNFTKNSDKFDNISLPTLPEFKNFDDEFVFYTKFIPDDKIRENIQQNKTLIKDFKEIYDKDQEDARDEKGQKVYQEYINALYEIKKTLPNRIQEITKQRVLWSCITGLVKYFDTTTLNKDNFADDFDINTQEGFQIQNNDTLYINGNIKGNDIGFYYNLTDENAQLQSDDFLHLDGITQNFMVGKSNWGKNNLGVQLPTLNTLSLQAQRISKDNLATTLEDASNIEELETTIKDKISNELLKNYGKEVLIKTRVERDIEKNITAQKLQKTFFPESVLTELNRDNKTDKITETTPRKIMETRDKTTENMRSDELRTWRSLIERLDSLISRENQGKLEPKRKKLLENIEEERWAVNYNQERGKHILKFFKKFSKNGKMNLQDLEVFINTLEKKEDITMNISKFSPDFQTEEDNEDANSLVENIA